MLETEKQYHVTEQMWIALGENTIGQEEFLKILEHTCECSCCAERLAQSMENGQDESLMPPVYLKKEILECVGQIDVHTVVKIKETSKKIQLMLYGLKVGLAVTVSVFILGVTANFQDIRFTQIDPPGQNRTEFSKTEDSIMDRLNYVANNASDMLNKVSNFILNGGK